MSTRVVMIVGWFPRSRYSIDMSARRTSPAFVRTWTSSSRIVPDRLAEEDHDRLDPGAGPDREADRGPQSELVREFGPPEFGLLAEVPDPDGGIVRPHPPDEAQAGSGHAPGVSPLDPADVLQVRRMPAPIEPEDRCDGIVEPDLAEDPFLRLADRGEDFRRGLE